MDLDNILKGLFSESDDDDEDDRPRKRKRSDDDDDEDMPSAETQKALLETLLEKPIKGFKVGDYIKRNKLGKKRYKWPKDGEVGIVTHVFAEPVLDGGSNPTMVHGEITVCKLLEGKISLVPATVDFRYYERVSSAPMVQNED